jgi:spore germination protein KC
MMWKCVIPIIVACLLLPGCSGLKNIQDINYITAIGMDYDEEMKEYNVYVQGLNFANVAKQEGAKPAEPIPSTIGSATGETLNLAVSKLYKKSEPPLYFGHVSTLIVSKNIVKEHFKDVLEEIGRNRSIRHTLRVMTTEESIEDVFNINALYNYPPLYTVLYKYDENELYQDELMPINLLNLLREYFEPMVVAKIPSVKIDKKSWKSEGNYPVVYFDGFEIFQQQKYIDFIPFNDAVILNWLLEKKVALNRKVKKEGELVAAVKIAPAKMKVKYEKGSSHPKFSIEVSASADILELLEDIPVKELESLIGEEIKQRIITIYEKGIDKKADVLNVGEKWYRKHPKQYHSIKNTNSFYLDKDSLTSLKVKVQVFHFNGYKYD